MVLPPPSVRKGKRSRARARAGHGETARGGCGGMVVATGREEKVTAGQRDTQMKVRRESLRKSLRRWAGRQAQGDPGGLTLRAPHKTGLHCGGAGRPCAVICSGRGERKNVRRGASGVDIVPPGALSPAWPLTGVDEPLGLGDSADSGAIGCPLAVLRGGLSGCFATALPWPGPCLLQPPFPFLVPLVWAGGDAPCMPRRATHHPHSTYARAHRAHKMGWRATC